MEMKKKAILYIVPIDPGTRKSLGSFTVYNSKTRSQSRAIRMIKNLFRNGRN